MTTDLIRFTQWAQESPQRQYTALMGMLYDPEGLNASFEHQAANKAPGVDGVRKAEYSEGLAERLADLSARLRRLGYRSKPVRRVYIPKASGKGRRALGVPSFEDRIVQDRASRILQAIWEPEFRDCSYGSRPERNAHQALKRLAERMRKKLKALSVRLAKSRAHGGTAMVAYVRRHLQGHIQYYGVSGNSRSLGQYMRQARRLLFDVGIRILGLAQLLSADPVRQGPTCYVVCRGCNVLPTISELNVDAPQTAESSSPGILFVLSRSRVGE